MKNLGKERISKLPTHFVSSYQSIFNFVQCIESHLRTEFKFDFVSYVITPSNIIDKNCHFRIDFTVTTGDVSLTRSLRIILLYTLYDVKPFIHCGFKLDLFIKSFEI